MDNAKTLVQSKTFWVNVVTACVVPFLPEALRKPEYIAGFFSVVNVALRLVTKGKITGLK
jgi:hypothetical protein